MTQETTRTLDVVEVTKKKMSVSGEFTASGRWLWRRCPESPDCSPGHTLFTSLHSTRRHFSFSFRRHFTRDLRLSVPPHLPDAHLQSGAVPYKGHLSKSLARGVGVRARKNPIGENESDRRTGRLKANGSLTTS
jgi:hypothetical protein